MRTPLTAAIGRAVRERREQLGLSQEELADRCDLHYTYVGGIERGERNPTIITLSRLVGGLEWSVGDLLTTAERELQS